MRYLTLALAFIAGATLYGRAPFAAGNQRGSAPPAQTGRATAAPANPDLTRFTTVPLIPEGELDEPMAFDVARDGRVFIIERKGGFKVFYPASRTVKTIATIPVNTKYTGADGTVREAEEGLVGFTLDPGFEKNRFVYLLFADPDNPKHTLVRWTLSTDDELEASSRRLVLEYPVQRETCCHTGGGMTWDAAGNLYLSVGNNTGNSQYMQSDERPDRASWDDQRGAANTNDLRGKILRIHIEPDGTYTIPKGNMFPPGTPNTRPEIYTMGHRNAWRLSLDSRTGYLYWGEVGPDQQNDSETGPRGYDEFNQARRPGFFGWPYFIGDNLPYRFADFAGNTFGPAKDPARPTNTSPNNTGLKELPPAQPSFIAYPYGVSDKIPELGSGARCAVGGPVFRRADFAAAKRPWPAFYDGTWLAADCSRSWIMAIAMDASGNYRSAERFNLPDLRISEPLDLKFGPDGDLYVLDYGSTWFAKSEDSKLIRIEYHAGNRAPIAVAGANRLGGTVPFTATLSSSGTKDHDGDTLRYDWSVEPLTGGAPRVFRTANPAVPFDRNGVYTATLTVTDPSGAKATSSVDIIAGNDVPSVQVNVTGSIPGNDAFFTPGKPIQYVVDVTDREDGSVRAGQIAAQQVALGVDYVPEGFDVSALAQGQRPVNATTRFAVAQAIVAKSDCRMCHNAETKSRGPSFKEMAAKYPLGDAEMIEKLAAKVRTGGTGVWGTVETMPSHPTLTLNEARTVVRYMLSVNETAVNTLPLTDSIVPAIPAGDNGRGALVIRAVYTDKGANGLPAQTSEAVKVLRAPQLGALVADVKVRTAPSPIRGTTPGLVAQPNAHIGFKGVNLSGVDRITIGATGTVGGTVELRLGSPAGRLLGTATVPVGTGRGAPGAPAPVVTFTPGAPIVFGPLDPPRGRGAAPPPVDVNAAGAAARGMAPPPPGMAPPPGTAPAAAAGRGGTGSLTVPIPATTGTHDLYLLIRNPRAKPTDQLMTVSSVTLLFKE